MLTLAQKELARHALGLPNSKRTSYRNRFVCQENDTDWQDMVAKGMATMRRGETLPFGGDACFYMTRKGAVSALESREKLCPEDFPVVSTKPILFSAPMIRALYDGRKTQTRRILKPQPNDANSKFRGFAGVSDTKAVFTSDFQAQPETVRLPYAVGDRLWVREAWRCNCWATDVATIFYKAHESCSYTEMCEQFPIDGQKGITPSQAWKPSIHMPRWISRLTLTITDVRIERLQDISEEDAIAEGISMTLEDSPACAWFSSVHTNTNLMPENLDGWHFNDAQAAFQDLWNKINGASAWDANPWAIALTFTVQHGNIDEVHL